VRRAARLAVLGALVAYARDADAQDFGGTSGPHDPKTVTSRLGVESTWASFNLNGNRGDFFGLTARADLRLSSLVSMRLLVPVYALQLDSGTNVGQGDAELRTRVLLYDVHPWRFYAGLADQLPTGNTSLGLGQGGSQLTPFLTGGWRRGRVVIYGQVSEAIALHPDKPLSFDYVDPSSDNELRYGAGAIVELADPVYVNAGVNAVTVLVPGDVGDTFVFGGFAAGFVLSEKSKVVILGQLPIAGDRRFDARLGLDAYLYF
jgi:hypothetical protein